MNELGKGFAGSPRELEKLMSLALGRGIAMVETESKRRTPVDTGNLRSSIGGSGGWKWVRGLSASVGTNVKYAIYVHEGKARHAIGQRKFMEVGAKAAIPFIQKELEKVGKELAVFITK